MKFAIWPACSASNMCSSIRSSTTSCSPGRPRAGRSTIEGEVVGAKNGRAVLRLDDLLVALRSADQARNGGISCSIDPTPRRDGAAASLFRREEERSAIPIRHRREIESSLGPQTISVSGVPGSSHFALVMVAADYRMKRLAMNLEPSPVKGMPSYLQMLSPARRSRRRGGGWRPTTSRC